MCSGCLGLTKEELSRMLEGVGGLSARAVLNYIVYELENGSDPCAVFGEAIRLAEEDLRDLMNVIDILKGMKNGRCGDPAPHDK